MIDQNSPPDPELTQGNPLNVRCTKCGVQAGNPCLTGARGRATKPHKARLLAAAHGDQADAQDLATLQAERLQGRSLDYGGDKRAHNQGSVLKEHVRCKGSGKPVEHFTALADLEGGTRYLCPTCELAVAAVEPMPALNVQVLPAPLEPEPDCLKQVERIEAACAAQEQPEPEPPTPEPVEQDSPARAAACTFCGTTACPDAPGAPPYQEPQIQGPLLALGEPAQVPAAVDERADPAVVQPDPGRQNDSWRPSLSMPDQDPDEPEFDEAGAPCFHPKFSKFEDLIGNDLVSFKLGGRRQTGYVVAQNCDPTAEVLTDPVQVRSARGPSVYSVARAQVRKLHGRRLLRAKEAAARVQTVSRIQAATRVKIQRVTVYSPVSPEDHPDYQPPNCRCGEPGIYCPVHDRDRHRIVPVRVVRTGPKELLPVPATPARWRSRAYGDLVRSFRCLGSLYDADPQHALRRVEAHHQGRDGMGSKISDGSLVPLCHLCHREVERSGILPGTATQLETYDLFLTVRVVLLEVYTQQLEALLRPRGPVPLEGDLGPDAAFAAMLDSSSTVEVIYARA